MARLRHHTVFTLAELNQAIHRLVVDMNLRPFQKLPGCRQEAFERLDKPALKPLPVAPYELATWKICRAHIDSHIEVEGHYYSIPQALCRQQVEARITHHTIEVFFKHHRVASHARSAVRGEHFSIFLSSLITLRARIRGLRGVGEDGVR
ncbi:MAG: Mu transposase domain-containing protein [Acidiferrobacter sp.]